MTVVCIGQAKRVYHHNTHALTSSLCLCPCWTRNFSWSFVAHFAQFSTPRSRIKQVSTVVFSSRFLSPVFYCLPFSFFFWFISFSKCFQFFSCSFQVFQVFHTFLHLSIFLFHRHLSFFFVLFWALKNLVSSTNKSPKSNKCGALFFPFFSFVFSPFFIVVPFSIFSFFYFWILIIFFTFFLFFLHFLTFFISFPISLFIFCLVTFIFMFPNKFSHFCRVPSWAGRQKRLPRPPSYCLSVVNKTAFTDLCGAVLIISSDCTELCGASWTSRKAVRVSWRQRGCVQLLHPGRGACHWTDTERCAFA